MLTYVLYFCSFIALAAASYFLVSRAAVTAVLSMLVCLTAVAGLWIGLQAEFLAFSLVLLYIGALLVVWLCVVLLLSKTEYTGGNQYRLPTLLVFSAVVLGGFCLLFALVQKFCGFEVTLTVNTLQYRQLAKLLYHEYGQEVLWLGVLLLFAVVAVLALLLQHKPKTAILWQQACKANRLRLH
jgi:NADH-quinone oxidoreductase subunit J